MAARARAAALALATREPGRQRPRLPRRRLPSAQFRKPRRVCAHIAASSTVGTLAIEKGLPLNRRLQRPLVLTLGFMLVVVASIIAGGFFIRSLVGNAFRDAERVRTARVHVADMVKQQLDEETGVRGYAAVRLPIMLAPYYGGRANLPLYFRRVRSDLEGLKLRQALPALRDAMRANSLWLHQVASPTVLRRRSNRSQELRGKQLVDRFRIDSSHIDAVLARRTASVNARAQTALLWVGGFAVGAVLAIVSAALIFTVQQYLLGLRLERERVESELERRKTAEARAAYEAEKRIADVLQEAFAERLFPALPAVSFSATYVPATEQTKIGGDWYDALQLSEHRVLLAIGDVTGHGIEAVVAMNKARQLLIGCALLDATPSSVLDRVNRELERSKSPIITAISAVIDTRTREFSYAAAGHPPPVLSEPGVSPRLLEFGSLPLGVTAKSSYQTHRVQTVPGAMIVLYTDGVIEHSRDLATGEAELLKAVESAVQGRSREPAATIRDSIFGKRKVADDVAILTVHLADEPPGGSRARATFTAGTETGMLLRLESDAPRRIA